MSKIPTHTRTKNVTAAVIRALPSHDQQAATQHARHTSPPAVAEAAVLKANRHARAPRKQQQFAAAQI